jgi:hypothetical protein
MKQRRVTYVDTPARQQQQDIRTAEAPPPVPGQQQSYVVIGRFEQSSTRQTVLALNTKDFADKIFTWIKTIPCVAMVCLDDKTERGD